MNEIIKNEVVDTNNDKYKTLLEEANAIMSPLNFIKNDSVPTINYYSGNDDAAGEVHYSLLKKKYFEVGYSNDIMIYARNNSHATPFDSDTVLGKKAYNELIDVLALYGKKFIINKN